MHASSQVQQEEVVEYEDLCVMPSPTRCSPSAVFRLLNLSLVFCLSSGLGPTEISLLNLF